MPGLGWYVTGLSPDTGTVLCDNISIVFLRIRQYEILWTGAEYGRGGRGRSASRISNTNRPTDPGGGNSTASNKVSEPPGPCPGGGGTPEATVGLRINNPTHRSGAN